MPKAQLLSLKDLNPELSHLAQSGEEAWGLGEIQSLKNIPRIVPTQFLAVLCHNCLPCSYHVQFLYHLMKANL